jgi:ectoine hydroxylase-related dioxygenase (phytanoyl-CoA dioxygenase family)
VTGSYAPDASHRLIAPDDLAAYRRDGAVLLKGVIDARWLDILAGVAEQMRDLAADNTDYYGDDPDSDRQTVVKDDMWRESPAMMRLLHDSPLARIAADAMGSSHARIYEDLLIYKQSGAGPTPWHQDEPQWPVTGEHKTSLWITLEATTPETGSLRFIAGSHAGPLYTPYVPDERLADVEQDMAFFTGGPLPDVEADPAKYRQLTFVSEPGDAILFHPRTIHAAMGSDPSRPRRTFSIRFLGDDIRWQPKASAYHQWLRDIDLSPGAPLEHERFPKVWPRAGYQA